MNSPNDDESKLPSKLEDAQPPKLENAQFIWDEYKYRHELIWKLIFQITTAVVAVSIIPYILNKEIEKKLGLFIIALPIIGLGLTYLSKLRMKEELKILKGLREVHRRFHKLIFEIPYKDESTFTRHVINYLNYLIILGILNITTVAYNSF